MDTIHVLIVEDNEDDLFFIKKSLKDEKYIIHQIGSGTEALAYLINPIVRPHIVLLDNHLPGINGIEILENLGSKVHDYGIIFLTIDKTIDTVVQAMRAGALDFIVKTGFLSIDLPEKISKVYQIHKSRLQNLEIQANFISVLEASDDLIWAIDRKYCITAINNQFKKWIYAFTKQNPEINDDIFQIIPFETLLFWKDKYDRVFNGEKQSFEVELKGEKLIYFFEIHLNPIITENRITGISAIGRDITEKKNSQEKIQLLQKGIEQSPASVIITNDMGEIEYVNAKYSEITGYTKKEALGKREKLIRNDKQSFEYYKEMLSAIAKGEEWWGELQGQKKSGEQYWESALISPIKDEKGIIKNYISIKEDITEFKKIREELIEREIELRALFENVNQAILLYEKPGRAVYANKEFGSIFGVNDIKQLDDPLVLAKLVDPEDFYIIDKVVKRIKTFENSLAVDSFEVKIIPKESVVKWIEVKIIPIIENDGLIKRNILIASDITQSKLIQRDIINAIISTEERERDRFAQDLHDGVGPLLSTVKLYIQILSRKNELKEFSSMFSLAESTLDEAITSAREISHNLGSSLLTRYGLIPALKLFIEKIEKTSSIKIFFNYSKVERLNLKTETTIYRITMECIKNVLAHAKASEIVLEIKQIESVIELRIMDDGIGFSISEIRKQQKGLGIFSIYNRIESIGGKVSIESLANKGTTVFVRVPFSAPKR